MNDVGDAGPVALLEFRIWERGHINPETLSAKLEAAVGHALWDVVLEYRLLPFPLCTLPATDLESESQYCPTLTANQRLDTCILFVAIRMARGVHYEIQRQPHFQSHTWGILSS